MIGRLAKPVAALAAVVVLMGLAGLLTFGTLALFAPPAYAGTAVLQIVGSGARIAAGTSAAVDSGPCAGKTGFVGVVTTAGSGTVTLFTFAIQTTVDGGGHWADVVCRQRVTSAGVAGPDTDLIENITAVDASGMALGVCDIPPGKVRGSWNITGTSPSETFFVDIACAT